MALPNSLIPAYEYLLYYLTELDSTIDEAVLIACAQFEIDPNSDERYLLFQAACDYMMV